VPIWTPQIKISAYAPDACELYDACFCDAVYPRAVYLKFHDICSYTVL